MKALSNFLLRVITLLICRQAAARENCSPFVIFPEDQGNTTCASSISPFFGPEVGGTVVKIGNGDFERCPLRSDINILCQFENEDGTFQEVEGIVVRLKTIAVECVSPFSGQPKDVKVSYSVAVKGCDSEVATKFEVDETFQYIGNRAGILVNNARPTPGPSATPSSTPTLTQDPSVSPSDSPSSSPSLAPTPGPSNSPSSTRGPTKAPSLSPSYSQAPTSAPTGTPFITPSLSPTAVTTITPSVPPSPNPTNTPTLSPTSGPSNKPSMHPTPVPSDKPTSSPTRKLTNAPTKRPTRKPIAPTKRPTRKPTKAPIASPSASPSVSPSPTSTPTSPPTSSPTTTPTIAPSSSPTTTPTITPSYYPSYYEPDRRLEYSATTGQVVSSLFRQVEEEPKQLFFVGNTIEVEWNSAALELSAFRESEEQSNVSLKMEILAYIDGDAPNLPPFLKIQSFNGLPVGSNKASFVLDDDIISPYMVDWGSNGNKVAIILVRVVVSSLQFWNEDDKDVQWILATRTSKLIGVLPESLQGNVGECPILPNEECEHDLIPCPSSHSLALEDITFSPDETCLWPSGNNTCDPRLDLDVDYLATCSYAPNSTDFCDDIDLSEFDEDEIDETDGCPCASSHPMATGCVNNGLTQCCYTEYGALITLYDDGAGRPTCIRAFTPMQFQSIGSFLYDTLPYLLCCGVNELDDSCESILNAFPDSIIDNGYDNPTTAAVSFGDPHLISFDRVNYNFNGFGEYVAACGGPQKFSEEEVRELCSTSRRRLQVNDEHTAIHYRFRPLVGNTQGATVHVGIAIQDPTFNSGTKTLIIILNGRDRLHFYDGSELIRFSGTRGRLRLIRSGARIVIPRRTNRRSQKVFTATIVFASGLKIKISESEGVMNPTITRPRGHNTFIGLMGQGDDDTSNDFKKLNGTHVPIRINKNITENSYTGLDDSKIFDDFGKEWEIEQPKRGGVASLFGAIEDIQGQSFEDFYEPLYRPKFDPFFNSKPSDEPSSSPSSMPPSAPSTRPSSMPSSGPSVLPSVMHSVVPSSTKEPDEDNNARQLQGFGTDEFCAEYEDTFIRRACIFDFNITENEALVRSTSDFAQEEKVIQAVLTNTAPVVLSGGRIQTMNVGFSEHAMFQIVTSDTDGDIVNAALTRNDNNLFDLLGETSKPGMYYVRFLGSNTVGNYRSHVTLTDGMAPVLVTVTVKVGASTVAPTVAPSSSPTASPTSAPIICFQNPATMFDRKKKRDCAWLTYSKKRRKNKCKKLKAVKNCPSSCGLCCADDKSFIFKTPNGLLQNCAWIAKKFEARKKQCNKKKVKGHCQLTCNNCQDPTK